MKETSANIELWNSVCTTDPKHTTKVTQRGGFTAISAQYQIREATKIWGPYGAEWGLSDFEYDRLDFGDQVMVHVKAKFRYPIVKKNTVLFPSFELSSTIMVTGKKLDDDWAKKVETDILTKALSKLGFNSDVFEGRFDDNKYVATLNKKNEQAEAKDKEKESMEKAKKFINDGINKCKDYDELMELEQKFKSKKPTKDMIYYWDDAKADFLNALDEQIQIDAEATEAMR